ncbi:MAG: hypothetical protein IKG44_02975 [Mogibacterium sp.]|nr:hypothetical protein [Mogibacterium sp.]
MPQIIRGKKLKRLRRSEKRTRKYDRYKKIRLFSYAAVILMAVFTLAAIMAVHHYWIYPGRVERDSISSPGRGSDFIVLSWDETQNTDVYKVWVKERDMSPKTDEPVDDGLDEEGKAGKSREVEIDDTWMLLETNVPEVTVEGLKENTSYSFIVRADNANREGIPTGVRNFRTKKPQSIDVIKTVTKFTVSEPFKLNVSAETDVMYESSDTDVAVIDPETKKIQIVGEGDTEITVTAKASPEYEGAREVVELKVLDSNPVSAGGASAHIIYHLDSDNCEVVKRITGAGGAVIPQGLAYTGDKYIVAYGMGSPNRIISFDVDGDGKDVSVPKVSMGHPNGFTYANENGRCYCVRGWTSKAYTYEPSSNSYGSVNLSYGCSGIGYDRKEKLLYTCSRTAMVAYNISDGYSVKYRCGVVKHSGTTYTQDCGGHAGIMFRCLSGGSKHGTNYIDLYHMPTGRYLGTISCDLSEVESCIVDNDGFLEILANNSSSTDYIWKTNINVDTLGEGL